ncbi:MAG: hypothetical protein U0X20_00410 [Caldilineaceae bacterium]
MAEPAYELHSILILSTSHITEEDADLIAGEIFPGKGGDEVSLLVYCGTMEDQEPVVETAVSAGYSSAFAEAVQLARRLGCRYLLFDNSGPTVDNLPSFDW